MSEEDRNFFLKGPISTGDNFYIILQAGDILYGVVQTNKKLFLEEINESNIVTIQNRLVIFAGSGDINNLKLKGDNGNYSIAVNSNNVLEITSGSSTSLTCKQSTNSFQNWNNPVLFLSGVFYNFYKGTEKVYIKLKISDDSDKIPMERLLTVKTNFYFDYTAETQKIKEGNINSGLISTFCSISTVNEQNNKFCDGNTSYVDKAWTTVTEAEDKKWYSYCVLGTTCGSGNCKGPCTSDSDFCYLDEENYKCKIEVKSWWKSIWFIVLICIIIFIFLLILICLILYSVMKKGKPVENSQSEKIKINTSIVS